MALTNGAKASKTAGAWFAFRPDGDPFAPCRTTSVAGGAASIGGNTVRSGLADQFNTLRDQLDKLADDASFNGINLLAGVINAVWAWAAVLWLRLADDERRSCYSRLR